MLATLLGRSDFSHSHLKLRDRLKIEALRRTNNGSMAQLILALISWIFVPSESQKPEPLIAGFALIFVVQLIRFVMISRFQIRRDFERLLKNFNFFFILTSLTAFFWALTAFLVFQEFGVASPQGILFILNISGYIAGLSYSFASVPRLQRIYIGFVGLPLIVNTLMEKGHLWGAVVGIFCAFLVYLFEISRVHAKDLLHTYKTEADLREQKEKLRTIINSVPGFVAVADTKGQWVDMSESFQNIQNVPAIQQAQLDFRRSQQPSNVHEIEWKEDEVEHSFVVSFARLNSPEDSIILTGVPVHELKAARREVEAQRSQIEFSSRLSTIGEMASGVAHEINNPLAIIVASTFQMQNMVEEATFAKKMEVKNLIRKIENTSLRISSIIRSLQYFAREGNGEPFQQASVPMIIENILNLIQQKFAHNQIEFLIDDAPDVSIPARPSQIGQALINLLNNAYDAVAKSTVKKIELRFHKTSDGLTFSISDSGPPISPEIKNRIFQPFFTTKPIGQGTGLGLSVAKGIIEAHQGTLRLTENSPHRTTFEFTIPWVRSL